MDNSIIRSSFLLLVFTIPGYIFNYLFLIVAGRILSTESFGILYTAISIVNVLSGPAVIISFFFAKRITIALTLKGFEAAIAEFRSIISYLIVLGCPLALSIFLVMLPFAFFIHINSFVLLCIVILTTYAVYLAETVRATFQGLKLFITLGIISLLWMVIRFLLGTAGLLFFKTVWASLLGVGISGIIIFVFFSFFILAKQHTHTTYSHIKWDVTEIKNLSFFCLSFALFMVIMYLDNIVAYFSLNRFELGVYSTASILAKAIVVISTPIVRIFFPIIVQQNRINGIKLFTIIKALGVTVFISTFLASIIFSFPQYTNYILGFKHYNIEVTRLIALSAIPLCILRVLIVTHLSRDYDKHPLILLPLGLIQLITLYIRGKTIVGLAYTYMTSCWLLVLFYIIFSIISKNELIKQLIFIKKIFKLRGE